MEFASKDLEALRRRGLSPEEASRQLAFFKDPPAPAAVERPCRIGDGIVQISGSDASAYEGLWQEAAREGRLSKFVPASGAATRMFKAFLSYANPDGGFDTARFETDLAAKAPEALEVRLCLDRWEDLALSRLEGFGASGEADRIEALLGREGANPVSMAKGLLPFHWDGSRVRTAFAEHCAEAAEVASSEGECRLHFTVGSEHLERFRVEKEAIVSEMKERTGKAFDISFSNQESRTDTLAGEAGGKAFRDSRGDLVFRPGGHGALLGNLEAWGGDIVFLKNIDNIASDSARREGDRWKRLMAGMVVSLQREGAEHFRILSGSPEEKDLERAARFLEARFGLSPIAPAGARREKILERLRRPIRVCGMVRNTGEPGGGPYWVRDSEGRASPQIVEASEMDLSAEKTRSVLREATHFNPVDLVCGLRDFDGKPYRLAEFSDPQAVFIAKKTHGGREILALEHPGLWNGAMAKWNTVFIEVPLETFNPVKRLSDLLRPAHRGRAEADLRGGAS